MWTWWEYAFFGFLIMASLGLSAMTRQAFQRDKSSIARCEAAQATVLEEADLITAAGKFPSEKITNRWKELLGGC